jgi:hypothetical protein
MIQFIIMKEEHSERGEDTNFNYYHEYCRLYLANVVLTSQLRELVNEKNELISKLVRLEKKADDLDGASNQEDRQKRNRRPAVEIDRHYRCPVGNCQKTYGSEGSMNQHIKIKHP